MNQIFRCPLVPTFSFWNFFEKRNHSACRLVLVPPLTYVFTKHFFGRITRLEYQVTGIVSRTREVLPFPRGKSSPLGLHIQSASQYHTFSQAAPDFGSSDLTRTYDATVGLFISGLVTNGYFSLFILFSLYPLHTVSNKSIIAIGYLKTSRLDPGLSHFPIFVSCVY